MAVFERRLLQALSLGSSSDNDEAAALAPKPRPDPAGVPVPKTKAKSDVSLFDIEKPGTSSSVGQPHQPRLDPVQPHQPRPDPVQHQLGASSLPAVILPCPPSLPSLSTSLGSLGPSLGNHDEAMLLWDPEGLGLDGRMNGSCTNEVCENRRSKRRRPTPLLQTPMMPPHNDTQLFSRILEYGIGGACFAALTGISAAHTSRHGCQVVVCSMLDGRTSYEAALQIARRRILSVISDDVAFYLGITENPARRFSDHIRHWDQYILLVEAGSSRITASMEIELLRELGGRRNCQNVGLGGETASAGSSHHLYLCVSTMFLMRRRPVHGSSRQ